MSKVKEQKLDDIGTVLKGIIVLVLLLLAIAVTNEFVELRRHGIETESAPTNGEPDISHSVSDGHHVSVSDGHHVSVMSGTDPGGGGGATMTDGACLTNIWAGTSAGIYSNVIIQIGPEITVTNIATGAAGGGGGGIALSDVMETVGTTNYVGTWAELTNKLEGVKKNLGTYTHYMLVSNGVTLTATAEYVFKGFHNGELWVRPVTFSTTEGTNRTSAIESASSGTSGNNIFEFIDNTCRILLADIRFMGYDGELEEIVRVSRGPGNVAIQYCFFHFNIDHGSSLTKGFGVRVSENGYVNTYQNHFSHLSYAYYVINGGRLTSRQDEDEGNKPQHAYVAEQGGFIQRMDDTLDSDGSEVQVIDGGLVISDAGQGH